MVETDVGVESLLESLTLKTSSSLPTLNPYLNSLTPTINTVLSGTSTGTTTGISFILSLIQYYHRLALLESREPNLTTTFTERLDSLVGILESMSEKGIYFYLLKPSKRILILPLVPSFLPTKKKNSYLQIAFSFSDYPDAFQSALVAQNLLEPLLDIVDHHSLLSPLHQSSLSSAEDDTSLKVLVNVDHEKETKEETEEDGNEEGARIINMNEIRKLVAKIVMLVTLNGRVP